ncbi:MAG TPA: hypothetical protein PLL30_16815 [Candidatus Krumholzibacteria bacterium]|nr:hypothetical protein [Candidatus Krumholzibacteria bacterium]HPD73436.1 hypothetical protein [Candidatus Krumholzibacteria bacterium]HRY42157.1 hypothetical protein [Candidatus Krumholzibacteria bacterium]
MDESIFWKINRAVVAFAKWLFFTLALWLLTSIAIISIVAVADIASGVMGPVGGWLVALSLLLSGATAYLFTRY